MSRRPLRKGAGAPVIASRSRCTAVSGGGGGTPRRAEDMHIAGTTPAVRRGPPTEPAAELAMHADVDLLDSLVASIAIYPPREGKGRRADCDRAGCVSSRRR